MGRVTGLREDRRGHVLVEVDGSAWRRVPTEVVVRAGIGVGRELDRPLLRSLRRELRRSEALSAAERALRARDLSERQLDQRLNERGVGRAERVEALATLTRAGLVDDARLAESRADSLAARGLGDEAIRWDLERRGIEPASIERALAVLTPEAERALGIASRRGRTAATVRYLTRKGFSAAAVEAALPAGIAPEA